VGNVPNEGSFFGVRINFEELAKGTTEPMKKGTEKRE